MKDNIPFPQADDFEKVVSIINIDDPAKLMDYSKMSVILGNVSNRQVSYYISAAQYLGFLDKEKHFTSLGKSVRELVGIEQNAELARTIVSDRVFGTVYFKEKMLGIELEKEDIVEIMKDIIVLDSDTVYLRRSSTVRCWIKWIKSKELQ